MLKRKQEWAKNDRIEGILKWTIQNAQIIYIKHQRNIDPYLDNICDNIEKENGYEKDDNYIAASNVGLRV